LQTTILTAQGRYLRKLHKTKLVLKGNSSCTNLNTKAYQSQLYLTLPTTDSVFTVTLCMTIQHLRGEKKWGGGKGHFATSISLKFYYWNQIYVYSDLQPQKMVKL
jgi:hypothetical protein